MSILIVSIVLGHLLSESVSPWNDAFKVTYTWHGLEDNHF